MKSPNEESSVVEKSKRNLKQTEPKKQKSLYAMPSTVRTLNSILIEDLAGKDFSRKDFSR